MTAEILVVIALVTYASRAAALVLLPPPSPRVRQILDRVPPALFAGLAAQSLFVPTEGLAAAPTIAGALGALAVSPKRSLPLCLLAGVLCFLGWSVLTSV